MSAEPADVLGDSIVSDDGACTPMYVPLHLRAGIDAPAMVFEESDDADGETADRTKAAGKPRAAGKRAPRRR